MQRDESLCASTSPAPFTLWRPTSGWVRRQGAAQLPYRVTCVDKSTMEAEVERCSRYEADTLEQRTQCWTAGCMPHRQACQPFAPPATANTPHLADMATCVAHATKEACEAEPQYRCRFDHDLVCVPNSALHVPLHMQRRLQRAPPPRTVVPPAPPTFRAGQRALLDGSPVTVDEVRRKRRSQQLIYRIHNHAGGTLWVPEDMLRPLPPSLTDPYVI